MKLGNIWRIITKSSPILRPRKRKRANTKAVMVWMMMEKRVVAAATYSVLRYQSPYLVEVKSFA